MDYSSSILATLNIVLNKLYKNCNNLKLELLDITNLTTLFYIYILQRTKLKQIYLNSKCTSEFKECIYTISTIQKYKFQGRDSIVHETLQGFNQPGKSPNIYRTSFNKQYWLLIILGLVLTHKLTNFVTEASLHKD